MAPETQPSGKGFLWRCLAQGAEPFHFRNRVRSLLAFSDSDGVEMIFSQPLPMAGFNYVIPRFSGEFEIPDEFFGASQNCSRTPQPAVPNLTPFGPRKPAHQEQRVRVEPSEAFSQQPSKNASPTATGIELPAAAPRQSQPSRAEKPQRETSIEEKRAEKLPASQSEYIPPRTEAVSPAGAVLVRKHEEILPDLRTELPRRKATAKDEAADQNHVSASPKNTSTTQPAIFAEEPPSSKSPVSSRSVPLPASALSHEAASLVRPAVTVRMPANVLQARQPQEVVPPGVVTARAQSLVAKSRPKQQEDLAPAFAGSPSAPTFAGFPSAQRSSARPHGDNRRFSGDRQQASPETFVTRQTPAEPLTPPPVVVVKQSSEPVAAAFWERRYLSHLHLRIRR
jgi:hypothetical protein